MDIGQRRRPGGAGLGLLLCMIAAVAACGSGGSGSETAATSQTTTSDSSAVPPSTAAPTTATTAKPKPKVSYPAGGVVDPVFPPNDEAFGMLVSSQCTVLLAKTKDWDGKDVADVEGPDTVLLYRSAAEACLQRWPDATRDFDHMSKPQPQLKGNCVRGEVYKWLAALIEARRKDPSFTPTFVGSTGRSPCASPPSSTTSSSTSTAPPSSTTSTSTR
jgi:hypothetical protein